MLVMLTVSVQDCSFAGSFAKFYLALLPLFYLFLFVSVNCLLCRSSSWSAVALIVQISLTSTSREHRYKQPQPGAPVVRYEPCRFWGISQSPMTARPNLQVCPAWPHPQPTAAQASQVGATA